MRSILLLGVTLALASPASAVLIDAIDVPLKGEVAPGQTILLGTETTGVLFTNESLVDGLVSIEFLSGPPGLPSDRVARGFQLLDGTLRISTNIPDGEKRVRIRIGYSERRILRAGLRAGSERLFRRVIDGRANSARWGRAIRAIRGRATKERFARSAPIAGLGNHGFDATNGFVWGFLDVTSDYAVAARTVAEPTSLLFMMSGFGLLLWSGRKKT